MNLTSSGFDLFRLLILLASIYNTGHQTTILLHHSLAAVCNHVDSLVNFQNDFQGSLLRAGKQPANLISLLEEKFRPSQIYAKHLSEGIYYQQAKCFFFSETNPCRLPYSLMHAWAVYSMFLIAEKKIMVFTYFITTILTRI